VTDEEWENIPEVGNLKRKKRRREERTYVVPDSVLVGDRSKTEFENTLDLSKSYKLATKSFPSNLTRYLFPFLIP